MKKIWIQCAVAGEFHGHKSGPFAMTAETFDQCVSNFDRDGVDVQWDIGHASEQGIGSAEAVGWISKLERRGNALFGLTDWLPETREAILKKQWKYASPAIRFGAKDPKTGENIGAKLTSMALVSRGFLKDLPPVTASDDARGNLVFCSESELEDENTEHELVTMADLDEAVRVATAPLSLELKNAQVLLADAETAAAVAEARATAFETKLQIMTEQANVALVEERFQLYKESRKLGANAKKSMRLILASDPELFESEYPALKNTPGYLLRKMADDPGNAATLAGEKPIPTLAEMIDDAKAKHPTLDYDKQFDLAWTSHNRLLSEHTAMMGGAA